MAPQTPMLLLDNVADRVTLYPSAVLTASSAISGREVRRLVDYRRELTWWQPIDDGAANTPQGNWVLIDSGPGGASPVDFLWIDRFSNLFGTSVLVQMSDDGVTWPGSKTIVFPAATVVGGDPSSGTASVTEEGAAYAIFGELQARRYKRVFFPYSAGFIPVVTGLMLGKRDQFLGFPSSGTDDDKERTDATATSDAGYQSAAARYSWRVPSLAFKLVGRNEYDGRIRALTDTMFDFGQPAALVMNWGDYPERSVLVAFSGAKMSRTQDRTTRTITIPLREVGHVIRSR